MPDLREIMLLDKMGSRLFRLPALFRISSESRLWLRRVVVISAGFPPLASVYKWIYKAHVWYAVRVLKRLPNARAIYVARGVALGEIVAGVSDVDLVVLGEWSERQHGLAMTALRRLSNLSPLYDAMLWQHAHSLSNFRNLYETDLYWQFRFDQGRTHWKLLYGDDVAGALPCRPAERLAGGYYMDVKNWWDNCRATLVGSGVVARDRIFRNSIAYKAVGELLGAAALVNGEKLPASRRAAIRAALLVANGQKRMFLERLERSAKSRFLRYDGDVREDTFQFLLPLLEGIHSKLGDAEMFQPLPGAAVRVDCPAPEVLRSKAAESHACRIVDFVKDRWTGYRGAHLVPSVSFFNLDDLMLLIRVEPSDLPSAEEVGALCRFHAASRPPQRIALLLLLREGAYQVETESMLELWHLLICPPANPDVFALLAEPEFVLDGDVTPSATPPCWTPFAQFLVEEELAVRRAAMAKAGGDQSMPSLELIRNLWRQLQLEVIDQTTRAGQTTIPLTPQAVLRGLERLGAPPSDALYAFRAAYEDALEGGETNVGPLLPEIMSSLAELSRPRQREHRRPFEHSRPDRGPAPDDTSSIAGAAASSRADGPTQRRPS
jgi:hypothetical protein